MKTLLHIFAVLACRIRGSHGFTTPHAKASSRPSLSFLQFSPEESTNESERINSQPEIPGDTAPASQSTQTAPALSTQQLMFLMDTSPRRLLLSSLFSTSIALTANFLGVTSSILGTLPESAVEASGLDTFYPRGDFKRVRGQGYTFIIPKEWVADTALELAKASLRTKSLDYDMSRRRDSIIPDAAFGPPGRLGRRGLSQADTNVSVVLSKLLPGFTLQGILGDPKSAAETLLRVSLAPEGSGRTASLIGAVDDVERRIYQFEYSIDRGEKGVPLRAISVIAKLFDDTLLTMTVVAPENDWSNSEETKFRKMVSSFHLT
jgi:hypothetical protein